jgi:hypothetical protein
MAGSIRRQRRTPLPLAAGNLQGFGRASIPLNGKRFSKRARIIAHALKSSLADYYEDIQEAARMKAGMKYKSQGERPTKYFTALVKQRSEKNNLTALTVKRNGSEVSLHTIEEILKEASDFYADLYSRKVQSDDSDSVKVFLNKNISNCLSDKDRETCDKALTDDELFAALKKLHSGKVPPWYRWASR